MPEIKIHCDKAKEKRGIQCLTFSVDGQMSGKWFHKCKVEGLHENYYVDRCIEALKKGLSREAFGGPLVTMKQGASDTVVGRLGQDKGRGEVYSVANAAKTTKSRSGKDVARTGIRWKYKLDGVESKEDFPTEALARSACAFAAFMSRGKLGRLKEAEEAFKTEYGKVAKVTYDGKGWKATTKSGEEYVVGFGDTITFKSVKGDSSSNETEG